MHTKGGPQSSVIHNAYIHLQTSSILDVKRVEGGGGAEEEVMNLYLLSQQPLIFCEYGVIHKQNGL